MAMIVVMTMMKMKVVNDNNNADDNDHNSSPAPIGPRRNPRSICINEHMKFITWKSTACSTAPQHDVLNAKSHAIFLHNISTTARRLEREVTRYFPTQHLHLTQGRYGILIWC